MLEGLGYRVDATGNVEKTVETARRDRPETIVLGIPDDAPAAIGIVDQLGAYPETVAIPVVVVSTSEQQAAEAQASPNVRHAE